jgi:hypothetical protein
MKMENGRFVVFGNQIEKSHSQKAIKWQEFFIKKFKYDPDEKYDLSVEENRYLGKIFGLKNIIRDGGGETFRKRMQSSAAHSDGIWTLSYRHGRRIGCSRDGLSTLLVGPAGDPRHHHPGH